MEKRKEELINLAIVSHNAFGAMAGGKGGHVGGVERQTTLMARWLASKGHQVSLLTWDEGQDQESYIDGVRVLKMCRQDAGVPGLRFFFPRWSSLNRALARAGAQIYYHNCAEYVTGQVALWCRLKKRFFVFSVPSDPDCDSALPKMHTLREKMLYRYGIRHADEVIVQTDIQQQMLKDNFELRSIKLPMPCVVPEKFHRPSIRQRSGPFKVGWVGRINRVKRLEYLLEVARELSDVEFHVAGKPDHENEYTRKLLIRANRMDNVFLHGMVPRKDLQKFYLSLSVLCCTSEYEGFPNTFLEAWSLGIPVISTVNPDNLLVENRLGYFVQNKRSFVNAIRSISRDRNAWEKMSLNGIAYFNENHLLDNAMEKFEKLFLHVANGNGVEVRS